MELMLTILSGIGGLTGLVVGALAYFKWKPKHPVEVEAAEVKIQADRIANDNVVISQIKHDYERVSKRCDELEVKVNECNQKHAEAEQQLQRIMLKCKLNCLVED